jgi:hypothetical protein
MIFGFNTDIKHADTVYHVQSEARTHDLLLQTQVFVRGRCIGKHATSYADKVAEPGFTDEKMHEMLKRQHREMIESIRAGRELESLFEHAPTPAPGFPPAGPILDASAHGNGLVLEWLNADAVYQENSVVMQFSVFYQGLPVEGARLTSRLEISSDAPIYSQVVTDAAGKAGMKVVLEQDALADAAVLVQATHGDHHATRKFRLRKHDPPTSPAHPTGSANP